MARSILFCSLVCLCSLVAGRTLAQGETATDPAAMSQPAAEQEAQAAAAEAAAAAKEAVEAARAAADAAAAEATAAAASAPAGAEAAEHAASNRYDDDGDDDDDDDDNDRDVEHHGKKHGKCKGGCKKHGGKQRGHCRDRDGCQAETASFCSGELCLQPKVRLRLRYDAIEQDPSVDYIGRNNGFGLSSGRLGLSGQYGDWLGFTMLMDGGFVNQTDRNLVAGSTFAALKDAWVQLKPWDFILVRAGQFKTPFDEETMRSTGDLRFVDRSVGARGIRSGEGYQTLGISPPRNLGVMAGAEDFRLGPLGMQYLVAVVNGNGENQAFNDNSAPAVYGRLALSAFDAVSLGVGGTYNPRTVGALPNLYDESDLGFTVDAHASMFGAFADASFFWINTQYPTTAAPDSQAMAATAEIGYRLWFGLGAGYRFGWYDPTSTFANDSVMEHSIGVRYDVPHLPLALVLDYTIALEQPGRELNNNRLGALIQLDI